MVWPMLAGLFGSLFGGGAAAAGGLGAAAKGVGAAAGAGAGAGAGAATGAAGLMGSGLGGGAVAGPMSMPGMSMTASSVAPAAQAGLASGAAGISGAPAGADMSNWQKVLESIDGDFESDMGPQGRANMQRNMQPQGIMDASQPAWSLGDFQQRFGDRERGKREQITTMGLMHPYVSQLLGGG